MNKEYTINDLGLVAVDYPITAVRIHKTDGQWLVEYRRQPKWLIDGFWWFNDGRYADYVDAKDRADKLLAQGYITTFKNSKETYSVSND